MSRYSVAMLVLSTAQTLAAVERPTVFDLLDRYAETQTKLKSFRITGETQVHEDNSYGLVLGESGSLCDVRFDGERISSRRASWGNVTESGRPIPKDRPAYRSHLWDGQSYWRYSRGSSDKGRVVINNKQNAWEVDRLKNGHVASSMLGYMAGTSRRMDEVLRDAREISLRPRTEQVNGVSCHVIDAKTAHGDYSVWLDPEHGYHVAKAHVELREGEQHYFYGRPFEVAGKRLTWTVETQGFQEIDGVWVPMESTQIYDRLFDEDGNYEKTHTSIKLGEVQLNPDHEALNSFAHDDIPEGVPVFVVQVAGIQYTWQAGKLVPNVNEAIIDEIDKITDEIMAGTSDGTAISSRDQMSELTTPATDLLDRYAATQEKLKSFIAEAESRIESRGGSGQVDWQERERCEFRFDGDRVRHRATSWGGAATTPDRPAYRSFLWDGEFLVQYRRGLDSKNNRVFVKRNSQGKGTMIATEYRGAPLMGICGGDLERVDHILRRAEDLVVAFQVEPVADVNCHVITAHTRRGHYTVWVDPKHDYNIARMTVQRVPGDLFDQGQKAQANMVFVLSNVRFRQLEGVWVPMEADVEHTRGDQTSRWHHERTRMVLDPDHHTLHSFVADDIPDGTQVIVPGVYGAEYTWQDGKAVSEVSEDVKL